MYFKDTPCFRLFCSRKRERGATGNGGGVRVAPLANTYTRGGSAGLELWG